MDHTKHTAYSDPGVHAALLAELPPDVAEITAAVRNLLVHYRAGGVELTGDRLDEVNNRWVEDILACDQRRHGSRLTVPRDVTDRVAGCCRDFALVTVAALRHHGVPARSRIGFASYFVPGFHHDHVVTEYWNGGRWVTVDPQLEPAESWDFDVNDLPPGRFRSAAEVWLGFRAGELDDQQYGVDPGLPIRGGWFIRNYVLLQLAHLQGDELLLWDGWGAMGDDLTGDLALVDDIAALLVAADHGDRSAEHKLAARYREDPLLHPGRVIEVHSPTGVPPFTVDLTTRTRGVLPER